MNELTAENRHIEGLSRLTKPLHIAFWTALIVAMLLALFSVLSASAQTGPEILVNAGFDVDASGFTYDDDLFRNTNQPGYASGNHSSTAGFNNSGGVQVFLGGVDGSNVSNLSGGWQIDFNLAASKPVTISFQYKLSMAVEYEPGEFGQALVSVDDVLFGEAPNDSLAQLNGSLIDISDTTTGWQAFQIVLGELAAGTHSLKIGGYNNLKTQTQEVTTVQIDNVLIVTVPDGPAPTPTATPTINPNGNVIFYADNSYAGVSWSLEEGIYDFDQIVASPIGNDAISSIEIPAGYAVTACVDSNGNGNCETYTESMPGLGAMDNQISYIEITFTPRPTFTPTLTPTNTPRPTFTPTLTPTNTPLPTFTPTLTPTNTPLPTFTPTLTPTIAPLPTATFTLTPTAPLPTATFTLTPTTAPLPTATSILTSTNTPLPTATFILTPTQIVTPIDTGTATPIPPIDATPTLTPQPSPTIILSATVTGTTVNVPSTATPVLTVDPTATATPDIPSTPEPSLTPTSSPTPLPTQRPSPTPTSTPIIPIFINEIDTQTVDGTYQFIELYDGGRGFTNLREMTLVLFNGDSNSVYALLELDGYTTGPLGYFVIGQDSLEPALNLSLPQPLIQNGIGAIALYKNMNDGLAIGSPITTEKLADAIVYGVADAPGNELLSLLIPGQLAVDEGQGGNQENVSLQRCPNGFGSIRMTDVYTQGPATPKIANSCGFDASDEFGVCGEIARPIHTIQGRGKVSPNDGLSKVVIEGVVIGDFQDSEGTLGGIFVQEESFHIDTDPKTSEGIFVRTDDIGIDVAVGDIVRIQGDVQEFLEQTQLHNVVQVDICGQSSGIVPLEILFPIEDPLLWEQYESMLVKFPQTLYISDNYNQGRSGELVLSAFSRLLSPTNIVAPGPEAIALMSENARYRIMLDDGSAAQNPADVPYREQGVMARIGDAISQVEGIVSDSSSKFRIQPITPVKISYLNERPLAVPEVGGTVKVASFNIHNYFNGNGIGGDFPTPRGADTYDEFERQSAKLVSAIAELDADIIGIIEIENDADPSSALAELTARLNHKVGLDTYRYLDTEIIGSNEIRVALLYKPASVVPVGDYQLLDSTVDKTFDDFYNLPSLAQVFHHNLTGETLTIVVNHLAHRDADCSPVDDLDLGDGQENCSQTRTKAAKAIAKWLNQNPTQAGDQNILIIGNLNAYAKEDPLIAFTQAGYTDLLQSFLGVTAYTYIADGQTGYLDHALASPALLPKITGVAEWHINADESRALDYNDFNPAQLYQPDPFRSSDHDPVIVGIDLVEAVGQEQPSLGTLFLPLVAR